MAQLSKCVCVYTKEEERKWRGGGKGEERERNFWYPGDGEGRSTLRKKNVHLVTLIPRLSPSEHMGTLTEHL